MIPGDTKALLGRHRAYVLGFCACGALLLGFLIAYALLGYRLYDSDKALAHLMTLHFLNGEWPLYVWGQHYFGTLFLPAMAACVSLFGFESFVFSWLPYTLGVMLTFALWTLLMRKVFGSRVALLTAAIMAVPGIYVLTFLTSHPFGLYAPFGILLLGGGLMLRRTSPAWAWALLGIVAGLGYWMSPSFLEYIAVFLLMLIVRGDEWPALNALILRRAPRLLPWIPAALFAACFGAVAMVASLQIVHPSTNAAAFKAVVLLALFAGAALLAAGPAKKAAIARVSSLLLGAVIGNMPQWIGMMRGIWPESRIAYHPPSFDEIYALTTSILPAFWGAVPPALWYKYEAGAVLEGLWICIWIIAGAATLATVWRSRRAWFAAACGKPLSRDKAALIMLCALLFIPAASVSMMGAHDPGQARYLLEAWPAACALLALALDRLMARAKAAAVALLLMLTIPSASWSAYRIYVEFRLPSHVFSPGNVAEFTSYLDGFGVKGGYGNYWSAYALDLLTREHFTIAPYYGTDRYPPYNLGADASNPYAVIISIDTQSPYPQTNETLRIHQDNQDSRSLLESMQSLGLIDPYYDRITQRIRRSDVIGRKTIGSWDVWILRDPQGSAPLPGSGK